jgi:hypothetical protein
MPYIKNLKKIKLHLKQIFNLSEEIFEIFEDWAEFD